MKQITQEQVFPFPVPPERVGPYIGLLYDKKEKYHLVCENKGYIFRRVGNSKWGHSGHSDRRDEACFNALCVSKNSEIFEFETEEEFNKWKSEV